MLVKLYYCKYDSNKDDVPCKRSQSHCWIKDNNLFVCGSGVADRKHGQTLNDLHFLDLQDYKWNKLNYNSAIPAPQMVQLFPATPNAYYDVSYGHHVKIGAKIKIIIPEITKIEKIQY